MSEDVYRINLLPWEAQTSLYSSFYPTPIKFSLPVYPSGYRAFTEFPEGQFYSSDVGYGWGVNHGVPLPVDATAEDNLTFIEYGWRQGVSVGGPGVLMYFDTGLLDEYEFLDYEGTLIPTLHVFTGATYEVSFSTFSANVKYINFGDAYLNTTTWEVVHHYTDRPPSAYNVSNPLQIEAKGPTSILQQPVSDTLNRDIVDGITITIGDFEVSTVLTPSEVQLSYQWYKDGSIISNGSKYSGVTTGTLVITNYIDAEDKGTYHCEESVTGYTSNNVTVRYVNVSIIIPTAMLHLDVTDESTVLDHTGTPISDPTANKDEIATWQDKSGNNRNWVQTNSSYRPFIDSGDIGIQLNNDGSNPKGVSYFTYTTISPKTIVMVTRRTGGMDTGSSLFGGATVSSASSLLFGSDTWASTSDNHAGRNSVCQWYKNNSTTQFNAEAGGSMDQIITVVTCIPNTPPTATGTTGYYTNRECDMALYEIICFDYELEEIERIELVEHLMEKHGIS